MHHLKSGPVLDRAQRCVLIVYVPVPRRLLYSKSDILNKFRTLKSYKVRLEMTEIKFEAKNAFGT